jgi:hypothetical protein
MEAAAAAVAGAEGVAVAMVVRVSIFPVMRCCCRCCCCVLCENLRRLFRTVAPAAVEPLPGVYNIWRHFLQDRLLITYCMLAALLFSTRRSSLIATCMPGVRTPQNGRPQVVATITYQITDNVGYGGSNE